MVWNWELPEWPIFHYDPACSADFEKQFLLQTGGAIAFLSKLDKSDYERFVIEVLSQEGVDSAKIEGEFLDRASLQSSIKKHFGLTSGLKKRGKKEEGMAALLCDVYHTFEEPLTHEMLGRWHKMLFNGHEGIEAVGQYRTHPEPMQIVSHRHDRPQVFFEAPPSDKVFEEMSRFIEWFNSKNATDFVLGKAAISHVYFESIHPFEDGNGRIGRALIEKILSQKVGSPVLITISKTLEERRKEYYTSLERCNQTLEVTEWVGFLAKGILQAREDSMRWLHFLMAKSKMMKELADAINPRQEKALLRIFEEDPAGFKGGVSAENYMAITKASRATATRDLADLVERGALIKTGELRHTRYRLNVVLKAITKIDSK